MKSRSFWLVLILGILLRLVLSFSTFHPDLVAFHLGGELIAKGNFLNLYDYIGNLEQSHPLRNIFPPDLFIYPPLSYLLFSLFLIPSLLFVPGFIHENMTYNLSSILGDFRFNFLLMSFKLGYLFFDLGIAFLLANLFKEKKDKFMAFTLWIFNPVNLYVTYMMGQFDIVPTFFAILTIYFLNNNKSNKYYFYLSSFALGIGGLFKIYPLLFVVPAALLYDRWKERISFVLLSVGVYILGLLPFLGSSGFRSSALVAGQTLKSFYAKILVSGGESIILYPTILIFIYLVFYFKKLESNNLIWRRFFVILLIFFVFTHYHPQWFIWITPFFVVDLVETKFKNWPLVFLSLFSFFSLLFFFEPSLTIGLFSPVFPTLLNSDSIWHLLGFNPDINFFRSIFHSIFVSAAFYYLFIYFYRYKN
jgi:hypothetical protein